MSEENRRDEKRKAGQGGSQGETTIAETGFVSFPNPA
jgi:hypothetical protein